MRLIFLLLALVAAATAVPKLEISAGNVDALKKQRDCLAILQQLFQDLPNDELRKLGREFDIKENIHEFTDTGVVKYLMTAFKLGKIQRKGVPFTVSIAELRKEVAVLTRTFLAAKDYNTFLKIACWARRNLNEAQFLKAFITAILQRPDTKNVVVLPPLYEVFPYYFFDARVIRKAQDLRAKCMDRTTTKKVIEIPVDFTTKAWLPRGEHKLAYFTQDIGLSNYYTMFSIAGWMFPHNTHPTDDTTVHNVDCDRCEIGRGAHYYYVHQQLMARYNLERLSNNLPPIRDVDYAVVHTPFKPHLMYPNGIEFPGRLFDINLMPEKEHLIKTVHLLERRLHDAIDSGSVISAQGSFLALYNSKGMNLLGNLIEGCGRSINPRYYGNIVGVSRELLGGAVYTDDFFNVNPSALELYATSVRDPLFYKLFKRIVKLFKRYQDSLPFYKEEDLIMNGVTIEEVKFDKLVTYCDKFKADIDAATFMSMDKDKEQVQIKAVMDRLNHKPFTYRIKVNSDKVINGAVVRVYMGPKFDFDGRWVNIKDNRHKFVEMDQFRWNIKQGQTMIVRDSIDAPMRSVDFDTKKEMFRKIENGLNAHESFYGNHISQMTGFPERLALPKGKHDGMDLQVVVIVSSPKAKTITYGPVVPKIFRTYHTLDFDDLVGNYMKLSWNRRHSTMDWNKNIDETHMRHSGERLDRDYTHDRTSGRYVRGIDDRLVGEDRSREYDRDTSRERTSGRFDTEDRKHMHTDVNAEGKVDFLNDYYKDKHAFEIIGGAISLDGRPLGFPFNRPLTDGCLWIPNVKVTTVPVFHDGKDCMY